MTTYSIMLLASAVLAPAAWIKLIAIMVDVSLDWIRWCELDGEYGVYVARAYSGGS